MRPTVLISAAAVLLLCMGVWFLSPPTVRNDARESLPGFERHDLEGLDPKFRAKVENLIRVMAEHGYPTYIRAGLRDQRRQDYWLQMGYTRTQFSKHLTGHAVDLLYDGDRSNLQEHVRYFQLLKREALALGLCPGAAWPRRSRFWARYQLGWDPAHVETCTGDRGDPPPDGNRQRPGGQAAHDAESVKMQGEIRQRGRSE